MFNLDNYFQSNLSNVIWYVSFKRCWLTQSCCVMIVDENCVQFRELITLLIWSWFNPGSGRHTGRITSFMVGCLIFVSSCIMATSYLKFFLPAVYVANFGWISICLIIVHCSSRQTLLGYFSIDDERDTEINIVKLREREGQGVDSGGSVKGHL